MEDRLHGRSVNPLGQSDEEKSDIVRHRTRADHLLEDRIAEELGIQWGGFRDRLESSESAVDVLFSTLYESIGVQQEL